MGENTTIRSADLNRLNRFIDLFLYNMIHTCLYKNSQVKLQTSTTNL